MRFKFNRQFFLLLFLICVIGVSTSLYLKNEETKKKYTFDHEKIKICVAVKDIKEGDLISEKMVTINTRVRNTVTNWWECTDQINIIANRIALQNFTKGQSIGYAQVGELSKVGVAFNIPKGLRAISIPIKIDDAIAVLIKPGNYIDVVMTLPEGKAYTIVENTKIIAIERSITANFSEARTDYKNLKENTLLLKASDAPWLFTLVVTPKDAQRLMLAQQKGKLSLLGRNQMDNSTTVYSSSYDDILQEKAIKSSEIVIMNGATPEKATVY